ncbi:MAG: flagellar filament capping protein FliD [Burkholderiaceae bacterium]|nr:flagellar filament capping protein FliD [Roseateles sp.]MBV8468492.1 flagellar filament capping protein FliD [Burkholderiaceae bacterium]
MSSVSSATSGSSGPALSSPGIGSGLDVNSIVNKLMAVESQPVTDLQKQNDVLNTKISTYGQIKGAISAMQDAANKLTDLSTWASTAASSSDSTAVSATAGSAQPGSYAITVSQLASPQSLSSSAFTDANTSVGSGTLTIQLGTWGANNTFTPGSSGPATINISKAQGSLSGIRDQINKANVGVTASIVTDSSGARLVLSSKQSGVSNGFKITVNDAAGNNTSGTGLSALAYDPSNSVAAMTLNQTASNAEAVINGLPINSTSNSLSNSIGGLSVNLTKVTSSPVTISVTTDTTGIQKNITDFVSAYNGLLQMLSDDTKYDPTNKQAAPLQGDSTIVGLQNQLRRLSSGGTSLGGAFKRLADIGLDPGKNGQLQVKSTKLSSALSDLSDLKQFFMGLDTANPSNNGFAQQWNSFANQVLGTNGAFTLGQQGLQKEVSNNTDQINNLQTNLSLTQKRLQAQYSALDGKMASMQQLSSYVSQQFGGGGSKSSG